MYIDQDLILLWDRWLHIVRAEIVVIQEQGKGQHEYMSHRARVHIRRGRGPPISSGSHFDLGRVGTLGDVESLHDGFLLSSQSGR